MPNKKAYFGKSQFPQQGKITLVNVISIEGEKQNGEEFEAFIDLANRNKRHIETLIIVDTTYLHRHYGKEAAETCQITWKKENSESLKKLDKSIKQRIISWRDIVESKKFSPLHQKIKIAFEGNNEGKEIDQQFQTICNELITKHAKKSPRRGCLVDYLLEECAGAAILKEFIQQSLSNSQSFIEQKFQENKNNISLELPLFITYPGGLNAAVTYTMENFTKTNQKPEIISYGIKGTGKKKSKGEAAITASSCSPHLPEEEKFSKGVHNPKNKLFSYLPHPQSGEQQLNSNLTLIASALGKSKSDPAWAASVLVNALKILAVDNASLDKHSPHKEKTNKSLAAPFFRLPQGKLEGPSSKQTTTPVRSRSLSPGH